MNDGIIYILINEAMPGYTKIGMTTSSVEQRMRELDSTGIPLPFECFHAAKVSIPAVVERRLHDAFKDKRVRNRREFFQVDPEQVRSALLLAQIEDVTPKSDVVEDAEDLEALNKARSRRSVFNFKMVGIEEGSILTFSKDDAITCKVIDNKRVEFEGQPTSLSRSAHEIVHRLGYDWKAVAGPDYWEYDGETLTARRLRLEDEDSEA